MDGGVFFYRPPPAAAVFFFFFDIVVVRLLSFFFLSFAPSPFSLAPSLFLLTPSIPALFSSLDPSVSLSFSLFLTSLSFFFHPLFSSTQPPHPLSSSTKTKTPQPKPKNKIQKPWCEDMLSSDDVDFWIKNDVLAYLCVDTGPTGAFGVPTGEADPRRFKRYLDALDDAAAIVTASNSASTSSSSSSRSSSSSSFSSSSSSSPSPSSFSSSNAFTVALVDGRFRVACALKAIWHLDHSRGVLLVHDWVARSEQYHAPILKRYELVEVIDRLAVLVPSSPGSKRGRGKGKEETGDDEDEASARVARWWSEAAEEMERYSLDPA